MDDSIEFSALAVLFLAILIIFSLPLYYIGTSLRSTTNGEKIGNIVQVERKGFLFKTWEGESIKGGMSNGNGSFGTEPFNFTIDDSSILKIAQEAMYKQREVKISFKSRKRCLISSETNNCMFVTNISYLN